jgi:hypothetical protein
MNFLMPNSSGAGGIPNLRLAGTPCFGVVVFGPDPGFFPFSGLHPQPLKVSIAIAVALLEQGEERVSKSGVHADGFSGLVCTNTLTSEGLFEESLLVGAAAVKDASWSHSWGILTTLAAGVMPIVIY